MPAVKSPKETPPLLRFKIRNGVWYGPDKKPYYAGTIVETDKDLAKAHPSKFIDLNKQGEEQERVVRMTGDLSESDSISVSEGKAEVTHRGIDENPDAPWRSLSIENVDMEESVRNALVEAELFTLGSVYDVYKEKGTLTGVKGIGRASEMKVIEAVKSAQ